MKLKKPPEPKGYVTTRMPHKLRQDIQSIADTNRRSLSSQIIFMLEQQIELQESKNLLSYLSLNDKGNWRLH